MVEKDTQEQGSLELIGTDEQKKRLSEIVGRLEKSPHGRQLMEKAGKAGYTLEMINGVSSYGGMNPVKKVVVLNEDISDEHLIGTLAHECRHAGQRIDGGSNDIRKDSIKTYLLTNYAMEADANVNAALATWQLKETGDDVPWKNFQEFYSGVAEPFEKSAKNGGIETGEALSEAFKGWYKTISTRSLYEELYADSLKKTFSEIKSDPKALLNVNTVEKIVEQTCRFGKNENYFKDDPKVLETADYLAVSDRTWKSLRSIVLLKEGREVANEYMKQFPNRDKLSVEKIMPNRLSAIKAHKCR